MVKCDEISALELAAWSWRLGEATRRHCGAQAAEALPWSPEGSRVQMRGRLGPQVGRSDAARTTRLAVPACRREEMQAIFHRAEEANQAVRRVLAGCHPKLGERECVRPPHEPLVLGQQRRHIERRTPLRAVARQSHRVAASTTWGCSLHQTGL